MMLNSVIICLGSNLTDHRWQNIENAIDFLKTILVDFRNCAPYETVPEPPATHRYCNAVAIGKTELSAEDLNFQLKNYEKEKGRTSRSKEIDQIEIDLDIVVFNNNIIRTKEYSVPYFVKGLKELGITGNKIS